MLTWLEQDLAANTNSWVIAYWHSPPYTHGSHSSDGEENLVQMREWVVPVLENHDVDLVLCGHSHCYERSFLLDGHYGGSGSLAPWMMKDSGSGRPGDTGAYLKPSPGAGGRQGAVYAVAGCSGQERGGSLDHPSMFTSLNHLGSVVIDVDGDRLEARFLRETGAVDDQFTILKGASPENLRVATMRVADGKVTAAWKSVAGQTYVIEKSSGLNPPRWGSTSGQIVATGATSFWTNSTENSSEGTYYRVVRVLP
jgi:hypothetical protein